MLSEVHHLQSPAGPQPHWHRCCCALLQTVRPCAASLRPGYAHLPISDPPLKLVLSEDLNQVAGTTNHLGVELASTDEVMAAQDRLVGAASARLWEKTSCFYAVEDKVGVNGPGAQPWEIYTVVADAEMANGQLRVTGPGPDACRAASPDQVGDTIAPKTCS